MIQAMKRLLVSTFALTLAALCFGQNYPDGYYKDVFMDGGLFLSSRKDLPATRYLSLSLETVKSAPSKKHTFMDTLAQNRAFVGSEIDVNGVLLYPDGAPRFRLLYVNGGSGATHGRSYTAAGRDNIRKFVKAGGSYLGSCAGAYLCCTGTKTKLYDEYVGVYPGIATNAHLQDTYVGVDVPENSPVLQYYDFGDNHIDSVYHNGGCYMDYNDLIPGGEILFNYNYPPKSMHGNGAVWCYKEGEYTGRAIACGPHPEGKVGGKQLDMMAAMVRYAIDGNGKPRIKGELVKGEARKMVKKTEDDDPDYTCIGDRQYHHFTVQVPEGTDTLTVSLSSIPNMADFDLFLLADSDDMAFFKNARYKNVRLGIDKVLTIINPRPGRLYVSVFCATTVESTETDLYGAFYTGRTDVLNGVPYIIKVNW